jgi:hypothetical protein
MNKRWTKKIDIYMGNNVNKQDNGESRKWLYTGQLRKRNKPTHAIDIDKKGISCSATNPLIK